MIYGKARGSVWDECFVESRSKNNDIAGDPISPQGRRGLQGKPQEKSRENSTKREFPQASPAGKRESSSRRTTMIWGQFRNESGPQNPIDHGGERGEWENHKDLLGKREKSILGGKKVRWCRRLLPGGVKELGILTARGYLVDRSAQREKIEKKRRRKEERRRKKVPALGLGGRESQMKKKKTAEKRRYIGEVVWGDLLPNTNVHLFAPGSLGEYGWFPKGSKEEKTSLCDVFLEASIPNYKTEMIVAERRRGRKVVRKRNGLS